MPEVSADGTTYTLRIKPGIYFADDPAFNGKKRELVAEDFVYAMKRVLDPRVRCLADRGARALCRGRRPRGRKARKTGKFDYDAPVEGLKVVDRYTFQVKIKKPLYVFIYNFADCRVACAVAREVVEKYGDDIGLAPGGHRTLPPRVLEAQLEDGVRAQPRLPRGSLRRRSPPGDPRARKRFERMRKGKRLPMIDRVEVSIIEETQPRWLSFLNEEMDLIFLVPEEFAYQAFPNNKLAKNLERRGIRMEQIRRRSTSRTTSSTWRTRSFGGYTPEKVALRRAISSRYKTKDEIAILRKGQAIPAEGALRARASRATTRISTPPPTSTTRPKAKALLDMFGYVDRDGDGYREMPDGSPLELIATPRPARATSSSTSCGSAASTTSASASRWSRRNGPTPSRRRARARCSSGSWAARRRSPTRTRGSPCSTARTPSRTSGASGCQRYDQLYEQARVMPDTPERTKLYQEMAKLVVAYAPWQINSNRIRTDMWYPQLIGYRRHPILTFNTWKFVDVDAR